MIRIFAALLLFLPLLCAGCSGNDGPESGSLIQPGDAMPQISVALADGTVVTTAGFEGRGGLLMFFNTGCADCRMELPAVQTAYRACCGDSSGDAEADTPLFLCVARRQTDPDIAAYWRQQGLTLPYSPQADADVYHRFAESGIPRIYIVGGDLKVRRIYGPESRPTASGLVEDLRWASYSLSGCPQ